MSWECGNEKENKYVLLFKGCVLLKKNKNWIYVAGGGEEAVAA